MARQVIKQTRTKTTYRKSKTKPSHCPTCGAFIAKRGNRNAKTRVYKWWNWIHKIKDTFYWIAKENNAISYGRIYHYKDGYDRML